MVPNDEIAVKYLLWQADDVLYQAKKNARYRVEVA